MVTPTALLKYPQFKPKDDCEQLSDGYSLLSFSERVEGAFAAVYLLGTASCAPSSHEMSHQVGRSPHPVLLSSNQPDTRAHYL